MNDGEIKSHICKYVFTENEKKEIGEKMALMVNELKNTQNTKKAVMSDFKSQIDTAEANIIQYATKLNNGYEMRSIDCKITADYEHNRWLYVRQDNGEIVREERMSADDRQRRLDDGL